MGVLPDAPAFAPSYGSAGQFTGMWFNPNSRGSRLRIWQPWGCKSLHAHHFAQVVQRRDGALKTRTVPVRIRPWALPQTRV